MEKTGSISRGRVLSRCPRWSCESHYHAPAPTPSTSHPPLPPAKALPAEGRWPHVLSRPRHTRCGEFPVIVLSPAAAWCVPAHPFTFRRCQRVDASSRRAALAEHADARVRGRGGRRRVRPGGGGGGQGAWATKEPISATSSLSFTAAVRLPHSLGGGGVAPSRVTHPLRESSQTAAATVNPSPLTPTLATWDAGTHPRHHRKWSRMASVCAIVRREVP
jgi:hypothetical protein